MLKVPKTLKTSVSEKSASAAGVSEKMGFFGRKWGGGAPPPFRQTPHETLVSVREAFIKNLVSRHSDG